MKTRDKLLDAACDLFQEKGFAGTSIGAIEARAGLAPRAGAFYRYFESKMALVHEIARERLTETPDEFDFEELRLLGDTRAELIRMALLWERAGERQKNFLPLFEELRRTEAGLAIETELNRDMLAVLGKWVASKPAGRNLAAEQLNALVVMVFGGWLIYLTKLQQGVVLPELDSRVLLESWASHWAGILDRPPEADRADLNRVSD